MKTIAKLKIIRGSTTIFFAAIIFICGFFPELNIQIASAVLSGCILGGIQGAGSAGIFIITQFIFSGFSLEQVGNFTAIFTSTFISGFVSGSPSIIEKNSQPKYFSKYFLDALQDSAFTIFLKVYSIKILTGFIFCPPTFLNALESLSSQ